MIRVTGVLGSDLTVVNAARASFAKRSERLTERDVKLINYLAKHKHTSPFRHAALQFLILSTLRERLLWQHGPGDKSFYGAGMIFENDMAKIIGNLSSLDETVVWRWTASLQAIATFIEAWEGTEFGEKWCIPVLGAALKHFPVSMQALMTGKAKMPENPPEMPLRDQIVPCLDDGYVRLIDYLQGPTKEETLVTFEVRAPLMVRSQMFKYVRQNAHTPQIVHPIEGSGTGNGDDCEWGDPMYARNEMSRRYVSDKLSFHIPRADQWRGAPENAKQGSQGVLRPDIGQELTSKLQEYVEAGRALFEQALEKGAAVEQARAFLPGYAIYTNWYWTASLPAVKFFLEQRLDSHAQHEAQAYARAVDQLLRSVGLIGGERDGD